MHWDELNEEQQEYVEAVLEDGGRWENDSDDCSVITRPVGRPDCAGEFKINLYGNNLGMFYVDPRGEHIDLNCGDVDTSNGYDIDALADEAGVCPYCGAFVGMDNMKLVWWAGRACKDCEPEENREFADYIARYGTD